MKLYHEGITRNTENKNIIAELKRAGYVEVKDEQPEAPKQTKAEKDAAAKANKDGE